MTVHWNVAGLVCLYYRGCHYHFLVKPRHWVWGYRASEHFGHMGLGPMFMAYWFK